MAEHAGAIIKIEEAGPEGPRALFDLEDYLRDNHAIRGLNPSRGGDQYSIYARRGDFGATVLLFALTAIFSAGLLMYVAKLLRETPGDYRFKVSVGKAGVVLELQKKATNAENLERCLQALAALGQDRAEVLNALIALGYDPKTLLGGK